MNNFFGGRIMETLIYVACVNSLEDENLFNKLYCLLPEYRQKKIDSYQTEKDKNLCLGVGCLLSRALKDADLDEKELEISYKDNGRPYFKNQSDIWFSLSHSQNMVMCGISLNPIGVDVEYISDEREKIVEWTKKESYVKASDCGMMDLLSNKSCYDKQYKFKEINIDKDYVFMACSTEKISDSQVIKVELN